MAAPVTKWSTLLAAKIGANLAPLPALLKSSTTPSARTPSDPLPMASRAALEPPTTNQQLLRHFSALLTRHGARGEPLVAAVQRQLQVKYGVEDPILRAVDAVKPVIKYYKSKVTRLFVPLALYPKNADAMALRWIIAAAEGKTYVGGKADIVRALVDEIDSIIQGSSALYQKRFNTHRNPN